MRHVKTSDGFYCTPGGIMPLEVEIDAEADDYLPWDYYDIDPVELLELEIALYSFFND